MTAGEIIALVLGMLLVIGGVANFSALNDPPKAMAFIYTHSLLRLFLSRFWMRIFNIALGFFFLFFSVRRLLFA